MPKYYKYHLQSRLRKAKVFLLIVISIACICLAVIFSQLNERLMPPILAVAEMMAVNEMNIAIDNSLRRLSYEGKLRTAEDYYTKRIDSYGNVYALAVNTILVNEVTSLLAVDISRALSDMGSEAVSIPLGILFSRGVFANLGPRYTINVMPTGNAQVDYETRFESVGINQIHFQLWLNVNAVVQVVNPIQHKDIVVERRIVLVNTIFSGQVPHAYFTGVPFPQINP